MILNRGVHTCTHVQFNGTVYHHTWLTRSLLTETREIYDCECFLGGSRTDEERSGETATTVGRYLERCFATKIFIQSTGILVVCN